MFRFTTCLLLVAVGCAVEAPPHGVPAPAPIDDLTAQNAGNKYLLKSEPDNARGAIAVRKSAKDGDEVVVVGRVGGSAKPFVDGRAMFLLVDPSLKPTVECDCPWDYCEYDPKEVAAARLGVKFVGADGKTIRHGAREMFGIKELSTVVVTGKLSRDEKDNVTVLASGIYARPEKR